MSKIKTYRDLRRIDTFLGRYEYLKLTGSVGVQTFGFDRWANQQFYRSREWKAVRDEVIVRDNGCDLGMPGYEIHSGLLVHHMNPMLMEDLQNGEEWITDPDYLITTSLKTHNAIHYGNQDLLPREPRVRKQGDTALW